MIWRPTVFGPKGLPALREAPPALRVEGGEATVAQMAMAQQIFSQFCTMARLSFGPNPSQSGLLPDGSRYQITTVGPQTIMRLWVEPASEDDDRRSGIVIALSGLDGMPLPGFSAGGVAHRYLLTPRVPRGSRVPNGKWRVRRLDSPYGGGKAVHANSTGRRYFTGIEGRAENGYPFNNGLYGSVNEYAYNVEDREVLQIFEGGNEVVQSDDEDAPIPFILEWLEAERYAAQLVTRQEDGITYVDLLVGPLADIASLTPVGPVVDTYTFPSGTNIQRFKISVSKDGKRARTVSSNGIVTCQVTFSITPTALTVESTNCLSLTSRETFNFETPSDPSGPTDNHNFLDPVDGIVKNRPGEVGTGTYTFRSYVSHVFAFGPRGQEQEAITSGISNYQNSTNISTVVGNVSTRVYRLRIVQNAANTEAEDFVEAESQGTTIAEEQDDYVFDSTPGASSYSGGGWRIDRGLTGGVSPVYLNRTFGFVAYLDVVPETHYQSWIYSNEGGIVRQPIEDYETPAQRTMRVSHKGILLVEQPLGALESGAFVAYSASDPMTGALCINLMQVTPNLEGARTRLRSWIFLVDDTGVKTLATIMPGLPADTCAITNRMLYSL